MTSAMSATGPMCRSTRVNAAFDMSSPRGGPDDVGVALAQNLDLKVLVVHGYQDLITNYFMSRYVLEQTRAGCGRAPAALLRDI